jgi:hypothetical protein
VDLPTLGKPTIPMEKDIEIGAKIRLILDSYSEEREKMQ